MVPLFYVLLAAVKSSAAGAVESSKHDNDGHGSATGAAYSIDSCDQGSEVCLLQLKHSAPGSSAVLTSVLKARSASDKPKDKRGKKDKEEHGGKFGWCVRGCRPAPTSSQSTTRKCITCVKCVLYKLG